MPIKSVFSVGDDALGVAIGDTSSRNALADTLRASGNWQEVVPGAHGLTVQYDPLQVSPEAARAQLVTALDKAVIPRHSPQNLLVIPVCYDDELALDMAYICGQTGLPRTEIIARHTHTEHRVDMLGFTPGFAYVEPDKELPDLPRLKTPRQSVPAGSVGLAAGLSGLYALPGPGGWPIIGRTPMPLFDIKRDDPFILSAGLRVAFSAISRKAFDAYHI